MFLKNHHRVIVIRIHTHATIHTAKDISLVLTWLVSGAEAMSWWLQALFFSFMQMVSVIIFIPQLKKKKDVWWIGLSALKQACVVCRQAEVSPNSWRETWWYSSTVETFLNTPMIRLWCSSGPAESHTPESWPCSSDGEVCPCVHVSTTD